MKHKQILCALTLISLFLFTLLLSQTALAAAPTISNPKADITGIVGRFKDTTIKFDLSGADMSDPIELTGVINCVKNGTTIRLEKKVHPTDNGTVKMSFTARELNDFPVGAYDILVSAAQTTNNDAIASTKVGTFTVNKAPYTITTYCSDGGRVYATPDTASYQEEIFINAIPDKGYYFVRWRVDEGDVTLRKVGVPNLVFNMPNSNVTLYALFRPNDPSAESGSSTTSNDTQYDQGQSGWSTDKLVISAYQGAIVGARATPIIATVRGNDTRVLNAPNPTASSIATLTQGTSVQITGYIGGYFSVLLNNRSTGYISGNELDMTIDPPVKAVMLQSSQLSDANTGEAGETSLSPGAQIYVQGRRGVDWLVQVNNQVYALPASTESGTATLAIGAEDLCAIAAPTAFPCTATILEGGVNVRQFASLDSSRIGGLNSGNSVTVTGYENGFWRIARNNGSIGYISANYVKISFSQSTALYGTTLGTTSTYSRANSHTSYFATSIPEGMVVAVEARDGAWCRLNVDGQSLWVTAQYIGLPTIQ